MNKTQFIAAIAERLDCSKADAERFLNTFMDLVTDTICDGEKITLTGFMTISRGIRKARKGVNPRDVSKKINIEEALVPKFKAGKALKDSVKKSK